LERRRRIMGQNFAKMEGMRELDYGWFDWDLGTNELV
jgi:hypothetical protein